MDSFASLTLSNLIRISNRHTSFSKADKRTRENFLGALRSLSDDILNLILADVAIEIAEGRVKHRRSADDNPRHRKRARITRPEDLLVVPTERVVFDHVSEERVQAIIESDFFKEPSVDVLNHRLGLFIDASSNSALRQLVCASCARIRFASQTVEVQLANIPNKSRLYPYTPHPAHNLFHGMLLHDASITQNRQAVIICHECLHFLKTERRPPFSLGNNMWVGDVPYELRDLSVPERLLIGRYFPAALIFKLFPKQKGARAWDQAQMQNGLRGNVSTYRLDPRQIASIIDGSSLPPPARILSATIGVTFVGPKGVKDRTMPDMFRVRRWKVREALVWLKDHNPLYSDITISEANLGELPANGIPEEIMATAKYSSDTLALEREHAGYVPLDAADEEADDPLERIMNSAGLERIDEEYEDLRPVNVEPAVIPMQALGVVDIEGHDISDSELFSHALSNTAEALKIPEDYSIRRSSAFVNEYARTDPTTGLRNDGGPSNPNHLLGCFPTLFPYGMGGFEVDRDVEVAYESHARWAMEYFDRRFRKDRQFPFQVFGVIQKRQVCRSAVLQMKKSTFRRNIALIKQLTPEDLIKASQEETRGAPFSHPGIRALRAEMAGVRTKVKGTDESRLHVRSKIWSTNLIFNPPSLWVTINPADTQNPIAQVFAGAEDIDLDRFSATAGPDHVQRAVNIAEDPFAAAQFFRFTVQAILEQLFGIKKLASGLFEREEGVVGKVQAYIGTVEAQGRGTLHLHMLLWLKDAPTAHEMRAALKTEAFREKMTGYIGKVIQADINGMTKEEILAMPKIKGISYSRPADPRTSSTAQSQQKLGNMVRALQYHKCTAAACLKVVKGRFVCKRRAPWATAAHAWVDEVGHWGPKRLCEMLNAFNPTIMHAIAANHDLKAILEGEDTSTITFYITNYTTKKQNRSSNVSALLAKTLAFSRAQDRQETDTNLLNKRLIQRCANSLTRYREFSAPEVMTHIMNWGDSYESHHYVTIFWDNITRALKNVFPEFGGQAQSVARSQVTPTATQAGQDTENNVHTIHATTSETVEDSNAPLQSSEGRVQLDFVDGHITLKDDLRDYQYRGSELESFNFLDFLLSTYETSAPAPLPDSQVSESAPSVSSTPRRGRPPNYRVRYKSEAKKPKRCRVLRTWGHETLPRFVGKWFPRNNGATAAEQEFYSASMLALLKPWTDMRNLKGPHSSFTQAFQTMIEEGHPRIHTVIHNVQYYYECLDGAKARQEAEKQEGHLPREMFPMDLEDEEINAAIAEAEQVAGQELGNDDEITEEDIEAERAFQTEDRQSAFGEAALAVAFDAGFFVDQSFDDHVEWKSIDTVAPLEQLPVIATWEKQLKATTRKLALNNETLEEREENPTPTTIQGERASVRATNSEPTIILAGTSTQHTAVASVRTKRDMLNEEQRRAHDIVEATIKAELAGAKPPQLRMLILGQGGTGKSMLIGAITETVAYYGVEHWLAKTATTGIAATEIEGTTLHSWAGLSSNTSADEDWLDRSSNVTREKRRRNVEGKQILILDEVSMLQKKLMFCASEIVGSGLAQNERGNPGEPFGGMHTILAGDFHQFPPVGDAHSALYIDHDKDGHRALVGREIFKQFDTVVILKEQIRVKDPVWTDILNRLRVGRCGYEDIKEIEKLVLTNPTCQTPDFQQGPWSDAILVTSRHSVRERWNEEAILKHCRKTGNLRYLCPAEDINKATKETPSNRIRLGIAGMNVKATGRLPDRLYVAKGMKAMVLLNLATEADIANGTRGVIEDILLDPREENLHVDNGTVTLKYPPAMLLFKPYKKTKLRFEGIPEGLIPITPSKVPFDVHTSKTRVHKIKRRQYALTAGYAFTDYKSQGQTIEYVIIDLAKPPGKSLSPFAAYVAMSRSRGRETIRILRDFERHVFQNHPSEHLEREMERLMRLSEETKVRYKHL